MGDLDFTVRIKTEYLDPTSLMAALGRSVQQGSFHVPARLSGGRPFVLVLATRAGTAAVKGSAEVLRYDEEGTWVRFLSSSDLRADADVVLDGVDISVFPPEAITHPIRALKPSRAALGSQAPITAREVAKAQGTGKSAKLSPPPPPPRPGTEDQATSKRPVHRLSTEDQQTSRRPAERSSAVTPSGSTALSPGGASIGNGIRTGAQPAQPGVLRTGKQAALAPDRPKSGQSAQLSSASLPALAPVTRTGQSAVTSLPSPPRMRTGQSALAPSPGRPGTGQASALAAAGTAEHSSPSLSTPPASGASSSTVEETPAQRAARRVARYSQGRAKAPSRHPRGLQMMPALSADPSAPPPDAHALDDSHMGYGLPLSEVPHSSTTGPLPAPLSSNTAPLPEPPLPEPPRLAGERTTGRGEAIVPLVSVVPWWNRPPQDAEPAPASGETGAGDEAAPPRRAATVRDGSSPSLAHHYAQMSPRAATMSGSIEALPPAREAPPSSEPARVDVDAAMALQVGAADPAFTAAPRLSGERTVAIPAEPAVPRRLLWSSVAIAVTCMAVAIAAIWWALDMRAASRPETSDATRDPTRTSLGSRRPATPMRNGSALGATASRPQAAPSAATATTSPTDPSTPAAADSPTTTAAAPATSASGCQLRVSSNANPSQIFVEGQPSGESPAVVAAPCGPVTVELRRARYATATRQLEATPGVTEIELKMARPTVKIHVTSRPPGAMVRLNGRDVGKTPLTTEVPAFERYTVVWSNRNGATATQLIYPQADGESFAATLLSSPWK